MREPNHATPEALLEAGIQALKAGWRQDAQNLIFKAIARKPTYVRAWIWMSEAYTDLGDRIRCLEQVISLDPDNEKVRARLQALQEQQIQTWLREGTNALEKGELAHARQTFLRVIGVDDETTDAWWGMAHAVDSVEDQIICLENVLTIEPDHAEASAWLSQIQEVDAERDIEPPSESGDEEGNEPLDLQDELACPYCGHPTEFEDRTCKACKRHLWVRERPSPSIPLYWILNGLELSLILIGGMIPLLLLSILDTVYDGVDVSIFLSWVVSPGMVSPEAPLGEIVPREMVTLSLTFVPLSVLALLCSVSRWPRAYIIGSMISALRALAGASLIVIAIATGFLGQSWESVNPAMPLSRDQPILTLTVWGVPIVSALIAGLSAVSIWAMMKLHTHFSVETRRMLLTLDRDVARSETGLWLRARAYAKRRAWALAALHARRALGYRTTVEAYLLLATAYYHLGQRTRARQALADAQDLEPSHPRIAAMIEQLQQSPDDRSPA